MPLSIKSKAGEGKPALIGEKIKGICIDCSSTRPFILTNNGLDELS